MYDYENLTCEQWLDAIYKRVADILMELDLSYGTFKIQSTSSTDTSRTIVIGKAPSDVRIIMGCQSVYHRNFRRQDIGISRSQNMFNFQIEFRIRYSLQIAASHAAYRRKG